MKDPRIKFEIQVLDNGVVLFENNVSYGFEENESLCEWISQAIEDERRKK